MTVIDLDNFTLLANYLLAYSFTLSKKDVCGSLILWAFCRKE